MENKLTNNAAKKSLLQVAIIGLLVIAGSGVAFGKLVRDGNFREDPPKIKEDFSPIQRTTGKNSFAPVVKKVTPSVVTISTTSKPENLNAFGSSEAPFNHPFFRRFFGDPNFGSRGFQSPAPERHGLGSGVIVSENGYILTNNHVVDEADEITVTLSESGKEYEAILVGGDPKTDLAVLKVDMTDAPYIVLGDSDQVEIGDFVLAVGNPFGVGQTVTMGMVSALGRGKLGLDYENFIQTDAAINPGNSGGALVDTEGRLIGINTAILSRTGGNHGIGFTIPINMARHVMNSLIENGRVVRGFLGVGIQSVTPDLADAFELEHPHGALVAEVSPDSPAEEAGFKEGDVIVRIGNDEIKSSQQLRILVAQALPRTDVSFVVLRNGKEKELVATLAEFPEEVSGAGFGGSSRNYQESWLRGVEVTELTSEMRRELRLPRKINGALVEAIRPDSPAYRSGLRQGDVILEVNRQPVQSEEDLVVEDGPVLVRVWNGRGTRFLVVEVD